METRIRMSTECENKNYYSALHYGKKYGIKHPLIIEYGSHADVAGREEERSQQIIDAFYELLADEDGSDNLINDGECSCDCLEEMNFSGLRDKLFAVSCMIDELLSLIQK